MRFVPPPRFSDHQQELSLHHSHTTSSSPFALYPSSASKLFLTGATIGPLVDSLHNQCLLQYHVAPIQVAWPTELTNSYDPPSSLLLASSWLVPPLLGIAYIVLGRLLPQFVQSLIQLLVTPSRRSSPERTVIQRGEQATPTVSSSSPSQVEATSLRYRAILAVLTTALIIQGSDYLERHPTNILTTTLVSTITTSSFGDITNTLLLSPVSLVNLLLLLLAALTQWAVLDGSVVALLSATIASIGGPLSELPFVGHDVWQYLPTAADYFPLQEILLESSVDGDASNGWIGALLEWVVVGRSDPTSTTSITPTSLASLGLSSLTGPCYFAVTMDSIALGRWFAAPDVKQTGLNI